MKTKGNFLTNESAVRCPKKGCLGLMVRVIVDRLGEALRVRQYKCDKCGDQYAWGDQK